jgi:hypothetical protein
VRPPALPLVARGSRRSVVAEGTVRPGRPMPGQLVHSVPNQKSHKRRHAGLRMARHRKGKASSKIGLETPGTGTHDSDSEVREKISAPPRNEDSRYRTDVSVLAPPIRAVTKREASDWIRGLQADEAEAGLRRSQALDARALQRLQAPGDAFLFRPGAARPSRIGPDSPAGNESPGSGLALARERRTRRRARDSGPRERPGPQCAMRAGSGWFAARFRNPLYSALSPERVSVRRTPETFWMSRRTTVWSSFMSFA